MTIYIYIYIYIYISTLKPSLFKKNWMYRIINWIRNCYLIICLNNSDLGSMRFDNHCEGVFIHDHTRLVYNWVVLDRCSSREFTVVYIHAERCLNLVSMGSFMSWWMVSLLFWKKFSSSGNMANIKRCTIVYKKIFIYYTCQDRLKFY